MSSEALFSSDRLFQVWQYTVSHRQLLLRSTRDEAFPKRLEILFKAVDFMAVPPILDGLKITACSPPEGELAAASAVAGSAIWYRLESRGTTAHVAAGAMVLGEDELEYDDPSALIEDFGL